jgi:hypothetical protein
MKVEPWPNNRGLKKKRGAIENVLGNTIGNLRTFAVHRRQFPIRPVILKGRVENNK